MAEGEKIKTIYKDYSLVFFAKKLSPSAIYMLEVYRRLQLGRPQMFQVHYGKVVYLELS
jgi:hypothetical protein